MGLPLSAYMASFALLTPFAGHWAVRFGVARTFALGAGLSAAGFLGAMAGGGYGAFVAARCLCAAGYAIGTLAIQQHFLSTATASERTRALALFVGAVQTAAICGSPVGGLLAEQGRIDAARRHLLVAVKNVFDQYCNVPPETFAAFMKAPSMGLYFNRNINGDKPSDRYECKGHQFQG